METVALVGLAAIGLWTAVLIVGAFVGGRLSAVDFPPGIERWSPEHVPPEIADHVADATQVLGPFGHTLHGGFTFVFGTKRWATYAIFAGGGPAFAVLQATDMDGRETVRLPWWTLSSRYGEIVTLPEDVYPAAAVLPPERGLVFRVPLMDAEQTKLVHDAICRALRDDEVPVCDDLVGYVLHHQLERMRGLVGRGFVERSGRVRPTIWTSLKAVAVSLPPVRGFALARVRKALEERVAYLAAGEVGRFQEEIDQASAAYHRRPLLDRPPGDLQTRRP